MTIMSANTPKVQKAQKVFKKDFNSNAFIHVFFHFFLLVHLCQHLFSCMERGAPLEWHLFYFLGLPSVGLGRVTEVSLQRGMF